MKHIAATLALLLMPFAVSCSNDGVTTPATDRITIETSAPSATLSAGETSTINITVIRPVGYDGPLTLTAQSTPAGVTASFSPSSLASGETASTLTLTADAGAPDGVGSIVVQASGADLAPQSATISVTVGSAIGGGFSISVVPGTVTVSKGGATSALIAIARTGGYSGAVSLYVSGFPAGVNASVSPGSTSGSSASILISSDNTVLAGSYTATITAESTGAPTQSATLSLTVMPALRQ